MSFSRPARISSLVAALTFSVIASSSALADTFTYTGAANPAVWNDDANWTGAGVPGAQDTAVFEANTTFTSFDGQSVGVIDADGAVKEDYDLTFNGDGTLTLDNGATAPSITVGDFNISSGFNPVFEFTGELLLTVKSEMNTHGGTFRGDTLTVRATDWGWKAGAGVTLDINRLNLVGATDLRAPSGTHNLPDLAGVIVDLGDAARFGVDFAAEGSLSGLSGSLLEMDLSYDIFANTPTDGENIQLASWTVGSTVLGPGTYDKSSAAIGDADFATIFGGNDMSFTVVPEPASLALLGVGGLMMASRRAR